ncbi:hypothetical protein [Haloarcula sp. JP-L23]|uniref:hypothetical protein n=1 Tax=Haloarcula sp. JP-L23 TaxID=2716717 RepID=UPI00140EDD13|nr:hypothetical protein G9465_18750 [Haloarcula sp. JP-L23]
MTNEITEITTPNSQSTTVNPSRRQFLRTATIGSVLGLAGCLSAGSETGEATPTAEREAIEDISFEGEHLVLTATEKFRGTELHVVGPTETVWAKTETEPTTGKARIRLLDVDGVGEDNHYSPGMFRFVFEPRGEDPYTEKLELVPDVSILGVRQRSGEVPRGAGQIAVKLQNSGTAPTWISDVKYEGASHYTATGNFTESDFPYLSGLDEPTEAIIPPSETREFVAQNFPLRFINSSEEQCSQPQFTMGISVKTPIKYLDDNRIRVKTGGETILSSSSDSYVCTNVELQLFRIGDE